MGRIAVLHRDLPPRAVGGVAYQVDLLARLLVGRGHEVTVFTAEDAPGDRSYAVEALERPSCGALDPFVGAGLAFRRGRFEDFDVVHAHGDAWALRNFPSVRTFHGTALEEARSATSTRRRIAQMAHYPLEVVSQRRCTVTTAVSENTKRFLPSIDRVIPNAVDDDVFFPASERFERPTILLVAGRLGGRKRGKLALDAFREVRRSRPDAEMIVVTRDEVDQEGVRTLAALSPERLGEFYRRSWALCSASSYEAFGIPYVEALASGLPIVTTPNPGAAEILGSRGVGVIVPPERLSAALLEIIDDAKVVAAEAQRGLAAARDFSGEAVVDAYEDAYVAARSIAGRTGLFGVTETTRSSGALTCE